MTQLSTAVGRVTDVAANARRLRVVPALPLVHLLASSNELIGSQNKLNNSNAAAIILDLGYVFSPMTTSKFCLLGSRTVYQ